MNETSLSRLPSLREAGSRSEAEGSSAEAEISTEESATSGFRVNLEVYSGPFDALLGMIANNRLELTEVSLSSITEEFLTYVRGLDFTKNMDEASAFLDIASILVEAKSVAILPGGEDSQHDEQSLEVLRERDLLFARLLQYRAYKQAAGDFRARIAANSGRFPHPAAMDEGVAAMLPELVWTLTPLELARLTAQVIANAPASEVSIHQLHVPLVDLRAQSLVVRDRLIAALESKGDQSISFSELTRDCTSRIEVVARFMAVLVFFKQGVLQYQQDAPFQLITYQRCLSGNKYHDNHPKEINPGIIPQEKILQIYTDKK